MIKSIISRLISYIKRVMSKPKIKRRFHRNGNIWINEYYLNGNRHRGDGPAYIIYNKNGNVECEYYILNGKRHREDGPAVIWYYENGNIECVYYYLNGESLTKQEWYNLLSTEQKVNLLYGKGNE